MIALTDEKKALTWSCCYFAIVLSALLPGAFVFMLLPTWTYNVFNIILSVLGVIFQVVIHVRYSRRVWPWLITIVYCLVIFALGSEFLRDGFKQSGR